MTRHHCCFLLAAAALAAPVHGGSLSAAELAIWNDPAFRQRFAESYLAETDIEPRVNGKERDTMLKVMELIGDDELEKAAALIEKHRDDASTAVFDFTLANMHFQVDHLEEAAALYETAVEKFPKFRRAWRNLGVIRVRQEDYPGALPALTRVIELGGGDAVTYGLLGFSCASIDNHLAAETAYRMAILLDPATLDWKMGLARSLFRQERFADAAALCGMLIDEEPERADLWLLQANAFIGLDQPMRAAGNYELVDRLGRSTPGSLNMLGDIYVNDELFELAVDAYVKAMDLDPRADPARAIRACKVLTGRGALDETRRLVEHIETTRGGDLDAEVRKDLLKLKVRMAVAEGAGEEEARILEEIVSLDPLDGEAILLLGLHHFRAEDPEQAIFYFERAANLDAFEAEAKLRHAQVLVSQRRYDEALPLLRRSLLLDPRDDVQRYLEQVERVSKAS